MKTTAVFCTQCRQQTHLPQTTARPLRQFRHVLIYPHQFSPKFRVGPHVRIDDDTDSFENGAPTVTLAGPDT